MSVVSIVVIFQGSFGHFYALTEFSMHLCAQFKFELHAHAPVHINWSKNQICVLGCMLRSHARNGNEFQTPGHRWLPAKHWDASFLNSSKSKTHLKFMKLGMLSWRGINMPWYKFCPIWGRFGYMLLTNRSFWQQAWWFSVGTSHLWGRNDIHCLLLLSKNFQCQHRTTGVLC